MNPCTIPSKPTIRIPTMKKGIIFIFIKGNVGEVWTKLTTNPKKTFVYIALGSTLTITGYHLISGDVEQLTEDLKNGVFALSRSAMLYLPELMADSAYTADLAKTIAENIDNEVLAGTGILGAGAIYNKIRTGGFSDTGSSIYHTITDSFDNIDKKRVARGLVCAGIIGAVMTSGCLDLGSGDDTTTHIPNSDSTESSTRVETPVERATATEKSTEIPFWEKIQN